MDLTPLRPDADRAVVLDWLGEYLHAHVSWWASAYGLTWSDDDVAAHLAANPEALVLRDWRNLVDAAASDTEFVGVHRDGAGRPVAIVQASVGPERFLLTDYGALDWIYVDPEARGRGLAKQLLDAAMAWMKARGAEGAHVFVTAENPAAVKLYEQAGFTAIDYRMLAPL